MDFEWFTEELLRYSVVPTALLVAAVHVVRWPFRQRRPWPVGGLAFVGLAVFAVSNDEIDARIWLGAIIAAVGSVAAVRLWPAAHLVAVAPGVTLSVLNSPDDAAWWMSVVAIIGACVAGAGADRLQRDHPDSSAIVVMVLGSVAAIWLTVPEADLYSKYMAVAVVLVLAAWPIAHVALGPGGGAAAFAVVAPIVVDGGVSRGGAIVGGSAVAGLLLVGFLGARLPGLLERRWSAETYKIVGFHAVLTFAVVRVAGLRGPGVLALLTLVPIYLVAAFVAAKIWPALAFERSDRG